MDQFHWSNITSIFCVSDYLQSLHLLLPFAFPGDITSGVCYSTQVHPQCKTLTTKQSPHFSLKARKATRRDSHSKYPHSSSQPPPHCSAQRGNDSSVIWRHVYVCITDISHLPLSISVKAWPRIYGKSTIIGTISLQQIFINGFSSHWLQIGF